MGNLHAILCDSIEGLHSIGCHRIDLASIALASHVDGTEQRHEPLDVTAARQCHVTVFDVQRPISKARSLSLTPIEECWGMHPVIICILDFPDREDGFFHFHQQSVLA